MGNLLTGPREFGTSSPRVWMGDYDEKGKCVLWSWNGDTRCVVACSFGLFIFLCCGLGLVSFIVCKEVEADVELLVAHFHFRLPLSRLGTIQNKWVAEPEANLEEVRR